jgi:hypothetical protein
MGNLLYAAVVILLIGWLLGFFVFHLGAASHSLLIIAAVIVVLNAISKKRGIGSSIV